MSELGTQLRRAAEAYRSLANDVDSRIQDIKEQLIIEVTSR